MNRPFPLGPLRLACSLVLAWALVSGATDAPTAVAADISAADPSDVVLVLDFSASILDDETNRNRFAGALDEIASYIDRTTGDLVLGDATVSIVRFATRAEDQPHCSRLALKGNYRAVADLADCLRTVAAAYRRGIDPRLTDSIGIHTNYVAALTQAAKRLPADAIRPAIVFFTDGEHDVAGVAVEQVLPARDRLFDRLSPFALLPVGMGLKPANRGALETGLRSLESIRAMEACEDAPPFEWSKVVFENAVAAGQAVARALGQVTCSDFIQPAPTPTPTPTPTPEPTPTPLRAPSPPRSIDLVAGDGRVGVSWSPPTDAGTSAIEDYEVRCRPSAGGDAIGSSEGVGTTESTVVIGLANGVPYVCEVAAANFTGRGPWAVSQASAVPQGPPMTPSKPSVQPGDKSLAVSVAAVDDATGYQFDCSPNGGATWAASEVVTEPRAIVGGLTNGTDYRCRAFASNQVGVSAASTLSELARPCGSVFDCNPLLMPIGGIFLLLLLLALLYLLARWYVGRTRAYITAQVDDFPTVTLGRGPQVGFGFVRSSPSGPVQEVIVDRSQRADVRIRYQGGEKFEVRSGTAMTLTASGRMIEVLDNENESHAVVLRAASVRPRSSIPVQDDNDWGDASRPPLASGLAPDPSWD